MMTRPLIFHPPLVDWEAQVPAETNLTRISQVTEPFDTACV